MEIILFTQKYAIFNFVILTLNTSNFEFSSFG